jgi:peptidyl-tRNA hydrolase
MTTEPFISAHEDPEGESPWALQCVVEETADFSEQELAHALSVSVLNFLDAAKDNPEWSAAVTRWKQGRIRKILRRARNSRWTKLEDEQGLTTVTNEISIRVFVPSAMDAIPANIKKCQVSGLNASLKSVMADEAGSLTIDINSALDMSPAKAAVACAHVAQLMSEQLSDVAYLSWKKSGFSIDIEYLDVPYFNEVHFPTGIDEVADVVIHDGGLTEVEPGSITAVGFWNYQK